MQKFKKANTIKNKKNTIVGKVEIDLVLLNEVLYYQVDYMKILKNYRANGF